MRKLGPVVRRRRRLRSLNCVSLNASSSICSVLLFVMLDARRFIQHHAAEDRRVKPMQPVIVRDVDARPHFRSIADVLNLHRQRGPSDTVLRCHGEQGQDQHGSFVCRRTASAHASMLGLAESGVGKDGCTSTTQRPCRQR